MLSYRTYYTFLFLLLSALLPNTAQAQYYATKTYGSSEGVIGSITTVFQHSDGAIWYGTYDNGIYRYDGQQYKHYSTKNGMANDGTISLFEDQYGNVWSNSEDHGTTYITPQGKVVKVEQSANSQKVHLVFFDKPTKEVVGYKDFRVNTKYNFEKKEFVFWDSLYFDKNRYEIVHRDWWFIKKKEGYWVYLKDKKTKKEQCFECKNGQTTPYLLPKGININQFWQVFFDKDDITFIRTATDLYIKQNNKWQSAVNFKKLGINGEKIISHFHHSNQSYNCIEDNKDGVSYTLLSFSEDFKICHKYPFEYTGKPLFLGNGIIKDKANNFWITSQQGLIKLMPSIFKIDEKATNMLSGLYQVQEDKYGKVWLGSYRNGAAYLEHGKVQKAPDFLSKLGATYFAGFMLDSKGDMLLMTENKGIMRFDGKNKPSLSNFLDKKNQEVTIAAYCIYKDKKGQILLGSTGRGIGIIPHEDSIQRNRLTPVRYLREDKGITTGNVLTITEDNYARYWFARPSKGIGVYDPNLDKGVTFERKDQALDYGAMSSITDSYGNIWFGSDKGLCYFTPPATMPDSNFAFRKNIRPIALDILGNSQVTYLKIWNNKYLIVGNALGMSLLDLEFFYRSEGKKVVIRLLQKYGNPLDGSGQNAVSIDSKNRVWAAAGKGVICFDPSIFVADTVQPSVSLDSIVNGKNKYDIQKNNWFKSENNTLQIHFHSPINDLLYENMTYRYRLANSTEWITIENSNKIDLQNLKSGYYCIEIQAIKDGLVSETSKVEFRILPWYLTTERLLLGFSLVLGLFFWMRSQKQGKQLMKQKYEQEQKEKAFLLEQKEQEYLLKQKEQSILLEQKEKEYELRQREKDLLLQEKEQEIENQRKEQDKLQVQAIVNQLNPHFINNALQWVQIRVHQDKEAVRVVSKLAENVKIVFSNSKDKKPYHSLKNEMTLVENYLFIQKKRFGDAFEFEIINPDFIEQFSYIDMPLMVLQLHSENAIEHGIKNREEEVGGLLKISFEDENEHYIKITIQDNGVGPEKAQEIGSSGTQQGTKMLRDLENIFNKVNEHPIYTQIYEDNYLINEEGERHGTRVTVRIPKQYRYEF